MRRATLAAMAVLACAAPALAQTSAEITAREAAGLFLQSCVSHTTDTPGLRAWAKSQALPALRAAGQAGFLKGTKGTVFDASNASGKYVVISHDDGGCVVLAQSAEPTSLAAAAEAAWRSVAITAVLDNERDDPAAPGMRHRTYHAVQGNRSWIFVISTGPDDSGQAMLSATRR